MRHSKSFTPRDDYQTEFLGAMQAHTREDPARGMAIWPRRSGKDLTALHNTLVMAHEERGMYWHCLPVYEQARKACWTAFLSGGVDGKDSGQRLMDNVFPREIRVRPDEWSPGASVMLVELKGGSIVQFVGSDTINHLVGAGLRGINFSEFALSKPSAWPYIQPILQESRGWASFLFTPRGRNHAHKLYQDYKSQGRYTSYHDIYTLGIYSIEQADKILKEALAEGMPEELVRQEYLCDFAASLVGSYFGRLIEDLEHRGGLDEFQFERDGIISTWDLGMSDSTAIWLWRVAHGGIDIIGHYEDNGQPLSHYLDWLDKQKEDLGLSYLLHVFPHDAKARTLVTGGSVLEHAAPRLGVGNMLVLPNMSFLDGIGAARWLLQQKVRIHPRCNEHQGIEALRQYHKKWDEDTRSFGPHPEHDWSSHSADAFRYIALAVKLAGYVKPPSPKLVTAGAVEPSATTLDELLQDYERTRAQRGHI